MRRFSFSALRKRSGRHPDPTARGASGKRGIWRKVGDLPKGREGAPLTARSRYWIVWHARPRAGFAAGRSLAALRLGSFLGNRDQDKKMRRKEMRLREQQ